VQLLEAELDKVFTFQKVKAGEIVRRIKVSEKEVEDVVKQLDSRPPRRQGGSSDDQGQEGPTEEDFALLEADLSDMSVKILFYFWEFQADPLVALRMSMIWPNSHNSTIQGSRKLSRNMMYTSPNMPREEDELT